MMERDGMTAEIAIMNREAIALAADSAVTVTRERGQKVFTSANKLFCLSSHEPVGAMIYGTAVFMGVPWETIVKIYRSKLGRQRFDTLEEYAGNFVDFLDHGNPLFPDHVQKTWFDNSARDYFQLIRDEITEKVGSIIRQKGKVTDGEVGRISSEVIRAHHHKWEGAESIPSIPKSHAEDVMHKYASIIARLRKEVFEQLPLSEEARNQLGAIAGDLFCKQIFPLELPGVVIGGFGEKEPFPSVKSLRVEAVINDRLKYKQDERRSGKITYKELAWIIPFAQSEMVAAFMEGVDPSYRSVIEGWLSEILTRYPDVIAETVGGIDDKTKQRLRRVTNQVVQDYVKRMEAYRREEYVDPVIDAVSVLPKDELAAMAETFVSLTSFKQKVTLKTETVAGPIDVAVISKGDGFVWIKRKHYFKPELNVQFLAKYFKETGNGEQ